MLSCFSAQFLIVSHRILLARFCHCAAKSRNSNHVTNNATPLSSRRSIIVNITRAIATTTAMDKTLTDNSFNRARIKQASSSLTLSEKAACPPNKSAKLDKNYNGVNMVQSNHHVFSSTLNPLRTVSSSSTTERAYSTMLSSSFSSHPSNNTPNDNAAGTTALSTTIRQQSNDSKNNSSMDDEYGAMESSGKIYTHPSPYHLESFGMFGHYTTTKRTSTAASSSPSSPPKLPRGVLNPAFINYNTYGSLNAARDNVIVICHALTGNASLEAWWGELLGSGKAFDTDQYFIVCCNILGSCYGSCGPSSLRPGFDEAGNWTKDDGSGDSSSFLNGTIPRNKSNRPIYGIDFPDVSVRDTVRLQLLLLRNELKINSIKCVIGGSFGGMQVMEYCVMAGATRPVVVENMGIMSGGDGGMGGLNNGLLEGDMMMRKNDAGRVPYGIGEFVSKRNGRIEPFVRSAVPIACGAAHTAWQIAISETQRQAIYADPKWNNGRIDPHDPPNSGLSVARQIGMVSYRTPLGYQKKFGRSLTDESGPSYGRHAPWQVKSYLEYQGRKFLDRFDPVTYVKLTEQMDSHDISRGRGSMEQVLSHVEIPVCVLGIDSDVLYPLHEQEELASLMPNADLKIIHSDAGHDGFLLEQDQVAAHIKSFLYSHD
ncbi:hypothetical protein HJC23_013686 [Cyclotella cryptica]|uniref:AB hydrolase-1 domain-containing protein n=1 Tax=Cyclotella cryptica TaxID=29204 RepID=A0ABD3QV76_9STRA|eukprot:CCRYP_001533-RA/>CCRYP_001533-RA protein AED:0.14 eAED:0.14 QI:321/1/1/1/0.75/0.6/5/228/653